jgi:signal transduction histidine kinase
VIAGVTLWFASDLTRRVRNEEHEKVRVWSEAIATRSHLVVYTEKLFKDLEADERQKADRLADAYRIIDNPPAGMDLTFVTDYLWANKTVPVLIYNNHGEKLFGINLGDLDAPSTTPVQFDSLRDVMAERFEPIKFEEEGHIIYYDESRRLKELKQAMAELISSFVSETVLNSASVPVILTDSTRSIALDSRGIAEAVLSDPLMLKARLIAMAEEAEPIEVNLPGEGLRYVYFEDSYVLAQMQYYPLIQLILIAVFLIVAYLVFSSFRRAEQNRVWVGMAKETAHQLGTPLSSLMAWVELLEDKDVDKSMLVEMKKDVKRLHTVTDRFSKIGSQPELTSGDICESLQSSVEYMRPRISKQVELDLKLVNVAPPLSALFNQSLLSWVLENLIRNSVDAMEGKGSIKITITSLPELVQIDIEDSGKGISRSDARSVFTPGFTTKKRGWGLGLSLTKRIIEDYHGGKITLHKTEIGVGTTFRIILQAS